jgi:hypothetical protein
VSDRQIEDDAFHLLQDAAEKFKAAGRDDLADRVYELVSKRNLYHVAFVNGGTGDFDIVESFHAADDDEANEYAERRFGHDDWYVLDGDKKNINGDNQ